MLRAIHLALLAALAGCPAANGSDGGVDGPPLPGDGGDVDRPSGAGGLVFRLVAAPALPGPFATVSIDEARVWLRDVRAIGDAAPGDSRTSLAEADLDYRSDRNPAPLSFPLAPPGLYSRLDARLGQASGGGNNGYQLRGHVVVGGTTLELEVLDEQATDPISVPLGGLRVDGETEVTVALDLSFLAAIDWSQAPRDSGKISLSSSSPLTAQVRAGMVAAWRLSP